MILHSFRVSTLWYLGKILRPNSRIVSIEISFVFSQHPFSNRRYQHSSALIGNIHSSSTSRNIDHSRGHPFCSRCSMFHQFPFAFTMRYFRQSLPFPKDRKLPQWISHPPKKKLNNNTYSVGFHFFPMICALLCRGFDIHLKIQPKKCIGCEPGDQITSSKRKKGNEYKARVPLHFIRTSTRLEAEIYLYCFLIIYI